MWNPFKSLIDRIMYGVEKSFAEHDHVTLPEKRPAPFKMPDDATPFERRVIELFETWKDDTRYKAIMVSIDPAQQTHTYEDPLTGFPQKAGVNVALLENIYSYVNAVRMEQGIGRMPVMLIDLKGPPLEQQIPGWGAGRIAFPDYYLADPLIAVDAPRGHLVRSKGLMGIAAGDDDCSYTANTRLRAGLSARGGHALAASPCYEGCDSSQLLSGFKRAVGQRPSGSRYVAPPHIRGVLSNDL